MFLRQAALNLIKRRFRFQFPQISSSFLLHNNKKLYYESTWNDHTWGFNRSNHGLWLFLSANTAIFFGINMNPLLAKEISTEENFGNAVEGAEIIGLRKVEDGSVISNIHTSKWRVFTDHARDLFMQGKLKEAEGFFISAVQEAKEGFGERDPHVASACNNLAELYRVNKEFDKAEPLYLEAINILEEAFGHDDVRVGAALHNLGQFYLVQRKLEEARKCYERALKIKGRVLGLNHSEYADTMYHLGMVLYLQGKEKDAEALILDSIRIIEDGGQADSITWVRRMRYLAQIYLKGNRLGDAENVQRKILHTMELTKGWNSLETIIAAEGLALTLQSAGSLKEAEELLERCLDARKALLPEDHIQIGANMLHLGRLAMLKANRLRKLDTLKAFAEIEKAKSLLNNSIRIAQKFLNKLMKQTGKMQSYGASEGAKRNGREALVVLLQSFDALGLLEITKGELQEELTDDRSPVLEAENALLSCISAYKKFGIESSIADTREVKAEYLSCLKHLSSLISGDTTLRTKQTKGKGLDLQDIKEEIKRLEGEVLRRKGRN